MKAVAFIRSTKNFNTCSPHGTHNGYVAVPPDNKYHGENYWDIPVYVHGGLTYSESSGHATVLDNAEFITDNTELNDSWWIFGFDTFHSGDNEVNCNKEFVIKETLELLKQLEQE